MEQAGFEVYRHQRVPANDGGIALGQAVSAGAQMVKNGLVDFLSINDDSYLTTNR